MKKILFGLLLGISILLINGCSLKNSFIGTYHLIGIKSGEEVYSKSLIETLGLDFELDIFDNNKATLKMGNELVELTYNNEKFISKNVENSEELSIAYTIKDNIITIFYDSEEMTFEKVNET